jgi:uncharacterized protein YecE (DUF72 family)
MAVHIGTSGWNYKHWRGLFYPTDVPIKHWLKFYALHFDSAEVNYSFYRLPKAATYKKWISEVPDDFVFTLKCSRLISHAKRLGNLGDLWENFLNNAMALEENLGPILFQLPEKFECDEERLKEFLPYARSISEPAAKIRMTIEFRHQSWLRKSIFKLLEKHNVALCIADSAQFPRSDELTADFSYMRFHGPKRLFASSYSHRQLAEEAARIDSLHAQGIDVYAYFNNDGFGYAVENAKRLQRLCGIKYGIVA